MLDDVQELVQRCLAGEQAAMFALVERFQGQVFGLCFRMLGHRQDAEDVALEAFSRALGSLRNWDPQRPLLPWLLAIAGNRCRTWLAGRARAPKHCGDVESLPGKPSGHQAAGALAEEVGRALDKLREDYRRAFLLFHEQELSYEEIAAALDCPVGTAKTWVHRARREMIAELARRGVVEESRHAVRAV